MSDRELFVEQVVRRATGRHAERMAALYQRGRTPSTMDEIQSVYEGIPALLAEVETWREAHSWRGRLRRWFHR